MPVIYDTHSTSNISSTPVCVLEADASLILDSLFITNTKPAPLLLTIVVVLMGQGERKESYFAKSCRVDAGFPKEFMNNSSLYFGKGDRVIVHSDHSSDSFDCLASFRSFEQE